MKWTWLLAISGVTVTSISAFAYGCSSDQPGELGDGTHMPPGGGAVPCIDGTTQACHVKVSDHGGVLTCFTGTQSCVNGLWGVCGGSGGTLTGTNVSGGALHMSSSNVPGPAPLRAPPMAESEHARAALAGVKRRFALGAAPEGTSFRTEDNAVRATFAAGDGGFHGADVMLPLRASDPVALEAHDAQLGVSFRMRGITDVPIAIADGMAVYAGAFAGADVVHRVHPEGTEDFVSLAQKPQHEELRYDVDVTRSSALRLVSNTLEFLDRDGVPRLRVAPPYVIDARGKRHAATLGVEGCAYDKSPAPPWGRAITRPEATSCVVRITWAAGLAYPLLVDPAWTATGSMATARQFHTATLLASGNVLVTGGTNGSVLQSAEVYGFGTGTWAATGAMGNPRVYHRQASLPFGSLTLIAGGSNGLVPLNSAELYDPVAGTFAPSSSGMVSARSQFGATFMPSGNYLLTGGLTVGGIPTTSAALYDPNADTFIATPSPMGTARYAHTTSTIGSVALIAGGNNGAGTLATAETFDESTGAFTATAGAMTVARENHAAIVVGGKVLLTGGFNGATALATASTYDPATGTFTATAGAMTIARANHTATLLTTGNVLIAGGTNGAAPIANAEIYDPIARTFAAMTAMNTARAGHRTVALGATGKVLVAGGIGAGATYLTSAELLGVQNGGACNVAADCASGGSCNDNVCCSAACTGSCTTCQAGTGACVAVTNARDQDTCTGTSTCNALGVCGPPDPNCTNNPCDPSCRSNTVDAGLTADANSGGSGGGTWGGVVFGPGGAVNPAFSKTGEQQCTNSNYGAACQTWANGRFNACQFDTYCNAGTCGADAGADAATPGMCIQYGAYDTTPSKVTGAACNGINLTLGVPCSGDGGIYMPVCNRGTKDVDAGTTITFYNHGGKGGQNYPNTPQCSNIKASESVTCAAAAPYTLTPGTCFNVTPATPGVGAYAACNPAVGNTIWMVNPDLSINECSLTPQPAGGYNADGGPNGCDDNWTDLHQSAGACTTQGISYGQIVLTNQYIASCPAGTHAQWSLLSYDTLLTSPVNGSSVVFDVQTAPIVVDGGVGAFTSYVNAATTPNDPQTCQSGDTNPCPKDLYAILGLPAATNAILNLRITLNPTSNFQAAPTLKSFQVTYSCPAGE